MTDRLPPEARLRAKALACVAQREHSRVELRRKLLLYLDRQERATCEADPEARLDARDDDHRTRGATSVDAVLDWLTERDLINAERFVQTRVQARFGRFGQMRIRQELTRHGVELDAAAAQHLRDTELIRAHALWARRFDVPLDAQARARQMRFLLARGFSADVVTRVLRGAGCTEQDES